MTTETFNRIVDDQLKYCKELLKSKGYEYNTKNDDKLDNFFRGQFLAGMQQERVCVMYMLKHIVSIYQMSEHADGYSKAKWIEKITDTINYLLNLRCILEEKDQYSRYNEDNNL